MLNRSLIKQSAWGLFLETLKDNLKYSLPVSVLFFLIIFLMNELIHLGVFLILAVVIVGSYRSVIGFLAVFITIKNFSFLYSPQKSDMYFSLPIRKSELFIIRALASIISSVLPMLALCSSLAAGNKIIFTATGNNAVSDFVNEISFVILSCLSAILFAVIAGKILSAVTSYVCFFASLSIVNKLVTVLNKRFLMGHNLSVGIDGSEIENVTADISSLGDTIIDWTTNRNFFRESSNATVGDVVTRIVFGVVCFALAWALFIRRKNDCRATAFAFKGIHFVIATLTGLIGFAILADKMYSKSNVEFLVIGSLISIVIAVLMGVIVNKGFKRLWLSLIAGLCTVALVCGYAVAMHCLGIYYLNKVPRPETVESVKITFEDGSVIESLPSDEIFTLHKKIAEELTVITKEKTVGAISRLAKEDIIFEYVLKDGKKIRSRLWYQKGNFKQERFDCYMSDEYFEYAEKLVDFSYGLTITSANFSLEDYPVAKQYMELLFETQEKDKKTFLPKIMDKKPNNRIYVTVIMPDGNESEMIFFMGDYTIDMMKKFIGKKYQYVSGSTPIY